MLAALPLAVVVALAPIPCSALDSEQAKAHAERGPAPSSPEQRAKLLGDLYGKLAAAKSSAEAEPIAASIERLWLFSGSDTIDVLMERSLKAINEKDWELALKLLDSIVELAPDYAEGWNRRAYVFYSQNQVNRAVGDIRRVLALEPKHFKALDGLAQIMRDAGQKKAALGAFEKLQGVNPNWPNVQQSIDELRRDVEGQGI